MGGTADTTPPADGGGPYYYAPMGGVGRVDTAIDAAADALLSVCALQTGTDPGKAYRRAQRAIADCLIRAADQGGQ